MRDASPPQTELVSVVVTTFNRAASLARALACLAAQQTAGEFTLEIIVVDNASTDETREVVSQLAAGDAPQVRYCFEPRQGLPFARNRGLREAQGEWIAFFDDDQLAPSEWLLTLIRFARSRALQCVGGARTLRFEAEPPQLAPYCRQLLGESNAGTQPVRYRRTLLPTTGNVLVHRRLFDALRGFDETWLEGGEDTEFFNRLVSSNVEAWYTPDAVVEHVIPANRTEEAYLNRIALRHGVTIGRRDLEERGRWQLPFWMAARVVHGAALLGPRLMGAKLLGRRERAFAAKLRLTRLAGYLRFCLHAVAPRISGQERFVAGLMHRETRNDAMVRSREPGARPIVRMEPAEQTS
jgi:glycosyltransferase involved in cell wall biosynthesis